MTYIHYDIDFDIVMDMPRNYYHREIKININYKENGNLKLDVIPDKAYELWRLLAQVTDGMLRARENELSEFDLTAIQTGAMFVIAASDRPVSIKDISKWLVREHHTVSSLITRMESKGLVKKVKNEPKNGLVGVSFTDKGKALFDQQNEKRKVITSIVSTLSLEEQEALKQLLIKLRNSAHSELAPKPPFP